MKQTVMVHVHEKCVTAQFYMSCAVKLESEKHIFLLHTDDPQVTVNTYQIS
jgi:hypothetical protein